MSENRPLPTAEEAEGLFLAADQLPDAFVIEVPGHLFRSVGSFARAVEISERMQSMMRRGWQAGFDCSISRRSPVYGQDMVLYSFTRRKKPKPEESGVIDV